MKPKFFSLSLSLITVALCGAAHAVTKDDNTTAINSGASWVGGIAPTAADVALFDSTITSAITTTSTSANFTSAGTWQFTNPAGNVALAFTGTMTVGNTGAAITVVDMSGSSVDATFGTSLAGFFRFAAGSSGGTYTLNVASPRTLTFNSSLSQNGNTHTLSLTGGGNMIFNNNVNLSGAYTVNVAGSSNVTMNGANNQWGTLGLVLGTLNLGNDTMFDADSTGLTVTSGTITASGGARSLTGTLGFAGTGGALTIGGTNNLNWGGTANTNTSTITVSNAGTTTFAGPVNLSTSSTNRTLTLNGASNLTISGVIANGGTSTGSNLTYAGSGVLSLTNANTYAGTTTVSSSTLKSGNAKSVGASRVALATGATLDLNGLDLSMASLVNSGASATGIMDNVSAGGNLTLTIGGGSGGNTAGAAADYLNTAGFTGVIKNTSGTVSLTKIAPTTSSASIVQRLYTGPSVLSLAGINTYTGTTTVKGGILQLNPQTVAGVIPSTTPVVLHGAALITINATGVSPTQTVASTTLNAGGAAIASFRQSSTSNTLNLGAITRNVGSTVSFQDRANGGSSNNSIGAGDGTETTTTTNANFSGGGTTILGGYAVFGGNTFAVSGTGAGNKTVTGLGTYSATMTAGTNVDVPTAGLSTGAALTVNAIRSLNATASVTNPYDITLGGDLTVATGGLLVAATNTSAVANASITGNFNLTSGNGQDLVVITNSLALGSATANMAIGSNITNNGATPIGLTKSGGGTLTLTPATANTFTGQVSINAGAVVLGNASALNGNDVVFGGTTEVHGGGSGTAGAQILQTNGTLTLNGNSTSVASLTSSTDSSGTAIVQNAAAGAATLTVNTSSTQTFAGIIQNGAGGGALALVKSGGGTQTLSGANTYTGNTTVSAGTLSLTQASLADASTVSIGASATLNLNTSGATDTVQSLYIGGTQMTAGVWGAVGSGAANTSSSITGTGLLNVTSGPAGFTTWITGTFANGTVPGGQQGAYDDPDHDGINNLLEYAVAGLDPTVNNGSVGSFNGVSVSFSKRQPLASDITYAIQESSDLGVTDLWSAVTPTVNNTTTISFTLPGGGPSKDFYRLSVLKP